MNIETHRVNNIEIAEILSEGIVIETISDGLDLLGDLYFHGFDSIILHEKNITPDFFDLKTGIAGEILQKFSNYRVRLSIVGNFSKYQSKSTKDFIYESNKLGQITFVETKSEAIDRLAKRI